MKALAFVLAAVAAAAVVAVGAAHAQSVSAQPAPWLPDLGDGTYRNPVIVADYSDPDVVRVGDDYYLVSSSFQHVPGLPILHSTDLVNWTIAGHAVDRLPSPRYDTPQPGKGLWAPSLRFHGGRFWIYVADPDVGVFVTTARDPRGPWAPLALVQEASGWIDPCPLWDDDGQLYLVHAWAKSRAGFNSVLSVRRLSPDGRRVVDEGTTVFDGRERHPTIEGPKFYKRNGYYYIFAPAGGVRTGWQTVLRSRHVMGPYEDRIVMDQGTTPINGPHQGAWVESPAGDSWFLHFQDRGAYGRVVHLQPMTWKDDWPVIGADPDGDGQGEPVATFRKPVHEPAQRPAAPATSDEFEGRRLGLQWQWQANPRPEWWSLSDSPGAIRLKAVPAPAAPAPLWEAGNLLLQKFPAETFTVTTALELRASRPGARAGLVVMGRDYAALALSRTERGFVVSLAAARNADTDGAEQVDARADVPANRVLLRATVGAGAVVSFEYSINGSTFTSMGAPFAARAGGWVGAKIGVFALSPDGTPAGDADVDWFRVEGPPPGSEPVRWSQVLEQQPGWYASEDAIRIADAVLLYQRSSGGWPKNIDMAGPLQDAQRRDVVAGKSQLDATIDNGATWTQLRFLALVYEASRLGRFREAFVAGLDYLLRAQYPNGGWPQFFPLRQDYSRHLTFNDGAMVGVLELLRDIDRGQAPFAFVDAARRARVTDALARGIRVTLATQVRVNGLPAAWGAQHDAQTLEPRGARTYEHPSLSGKETVGIVSFLMSLDRPTPEVVAAIEGAVSWLRAVQIEGLRVDQQKDPAAPRGFDVVVVEDPGAPPVWARFYELATLRPIFSGRDGVVKYRLADIEYERRTGYSWLGPYAADLLSKEYPAWRKRTATASPR